MTGIIIFAMVALFLSLRLYSVLGKRTGHEQAFRPPEDAPAAAPTAGSPTEEPRAKAVTDEAELSDVEPSAEAGVRAIAAATRNFDAGEFLGGATEAYRMILEAYWKGELSEIAGFLAEDVREAFEEAITTRTEAGEVLDNRLVTIDRAVISKAELDGRDARITVRFDADIAAVTRDTEGNVLAGSLSDAVPTHDCWIFARDIKARDPNWILIDTDEAS